MMVLYLSEGEDLGVMKMETLLNNFVTSGLPPEELKNVIFDMDAQGFHIGRHDFGAYFVIALDLPHHTISVQAKSKPAFKGAKDYSHI